MIREHFSKRTRAPQPQLLIVAMIWAIALLCLHDGSQPKWAWYMVGLATVFTVYVAVRLWLYFGTRKVR
jgi:uncharacterized membrane protein YoaK (UPF0700 family)